MTYKAEVEAKLLAAEQEKEALREAAFNRWEAGMAGLTPDEVRKRYLGERIFTAEEQDQLDILENQIRAYSHFLRTFCKPKPESLHEMAKSQIDESTYSNIF